MFNQPTRNANLTLTAIQLLEERLPVVIRVSGNCFGLGLGYGVQTIGQDPANDPGGPPRRRSRT